jgi:hypothetical protein
MRQTLLFDFTSTTTPFTVDVSKTQFNSLGNPKNTHGRKGTYLTAEELKEALQYYFSGSQDEKQRGLQKYGKRKIKHALAICKLDMGKQGKVGRHVCSFHGAKYLVFNWTGSEDGVRIRCFAPGGCSFNTHHDGYLFQGTEKQFDEQAE